jgi:hypothetical protein
MEFPDARPRRSVTRLMCAASRSGAKKKKEEEGKMAREGAGRIRLEHPIRLPPNGFRIYL